MRIDKLTTKFQQALADAQSLALQNHHPYLVPIHVLAALLADTDSGAGSLLARAGVAVPRLQGLVNQAVEALPQVQANEVNLQVSRELQSALAHTEKEATTRGIPILPVSCFYWS